MSYAFVDDSAIENRLPLFKFHCKISETYFGCPYKISASYNYDENFPHGALAHIGRHNIEYKISSTLKSLIHTVLHEFAHILQYEYANYSCHDLAFCFINNVLIYRHYRKDGILLRAYDIHEDKGAQLLRWSFRDFEQIIEFLSSIKDTKTMCEEAFLLANFFAFTMPGTDSWDWPTIDRDEVAQRLGEHFPLINPRY